MTNDTVDTLVATLSRFVELPKPQREQLGSLRRRRIDVTRHADLVQEGDPTDDLYIVERGWLEQYRVLVDGRRCVLRVSLPGDVVDGAFPLLGRARSSIAALTPAKVLLVRSDSLLDLIRSDATIALGFLYLEAYQHSFSRERVATLARLSAYERLGHLCLELLVRLEAAGQADGDEFTLPVSQPMLGEVLGMHAVHVNRMFRRLTADGFIARNGEQVRIMDRAGLARLVEFRPPDLARRPGGDGKTARPAPGEEGRARP